jgi:hypothetical protein
MISGTKIRAEAGSGPRSVIPSSSSSVFDGLHAHGGFRFLPGADAEQVSILGYQDRRVLIILLGIQFVLQIFLSFRSKTVSLRENLLDISGPLSWASSSPRGGPLHRSDLSAILIYASTAKRFTTGMILLGFYSRVWDCLSFWPPAFNLFLSTFEKIKRYMRVVIFISDSF